METQNKGRGTTLVTEQMIGALSFIILIFECQLESPAQLRRHHVSTSVTSLINLSQTNMFNRVSVDSESGIKCSTPPRPPPPQSSGSTPVWNRLLQIHINSCLYGTETSTADTVDAACCVA